MNAVERISKYLDETKVFSFITIDENKPQARPFGFHMLVDGKIYFGCGTFKNVYKQILKNPNVEVMATGNGTFLRYDGKAHIVCDDKLIEEVRKRMPDIMALYDKSGWSMGLFYLEDAHAEIRNLFNAIESYDL